MATETERIRIKMESYDHRTLDASAKEIVEHARKTNARVSGPVPLPTRVERYYEVHILIKNRVSSLN